MSQKGHPKQWKFALLVWCFIYPAITILSMILIPNLSFLPIPFRTLLVSLILVPLMAFLYIPFINRRFHVWLRK